MLIFLVIEMLTLDLTFLMLSIGGLAGLGADLLGAPLWLQVISAAAVAAILLLALRPALLRRLHRGSDTSPSTVHALLGLAGRLLATVPSVTGQLQLHHCHLLPPRRHRRRDPSARPAARAAATPAPGIGHQSVQRRRAPGPGRARARDRLVGDRPGQARQWRRVDRPQ